MTNKFKITCEVPEKQLGKLMAAVIDNGAAILDIGLVVVEKKDSSGKQPAYSDRKSPPGAAREAIVQFFAQSAGKVASYDSLRAVLTRAAIAPAGQGAAIGAMVRAGSLHRSGRAGNYSFRYIPKKGG